ncbi:hypothetical protein PMAA_089840 [Talaromyces marneffei ATCC 18224]|uniref:Uncharacterized protein n=1 Tax=Talaromyces marneffei (strain ATCC 18224 / CBS 334.59 / QM 7333) TaxID=441960 RepID=B6QEW3_TALMQ|nr:hypothetical protein PMAA_089840 [Talaromyces marneffei ATCC 18224]
MAILTFIIKVGNYGAKVPVSPTVVLMVLGDVFLKNQFVVFLGKPTPQIGLAAQA